MAAVDELMLYDDMQYTRRDWRNRNKTESPQEWQMAETAHYPDVQTKKIA